MGYYARALPHKKNLPNWKIQYISTRKKDRKENSVAKITKTTWDVSKDRWSSLGFHQSMTVDEAHARARRLNAQLQLKRQEEVVQKIKITEADFMMIQCGKWKPCQQDENCYGFFKQRLLLFHLKTAGSQFLFFLMSNISL